MTVKRVYLDYAATTSVDPEVVLVMQPYFLEKYGNSSSIHRFGQEALKSLDEARETIKNFLGAKEQREIIFTGSATEANNLAIKGLIFKIQSARGRAKLKTRPHIITSEIEHESVLEPVRWLEKSGFADVTYIKPNSNGLIGVGDVESALQPDTVLVSIHYANNEIGTIQPVREIGKVIERFKEKSGLRPVYFHSDAVQAIQFLDSFVDKLKVDLLTLSSHKIYGPKGIGALYVRQGVELEPVLHGGGQEYGLRSGTENIPLIVGFAVAVKKVIATREQENIRLKILRDIFLAKLQKIYPRVIINGSWENRLPNNLNVTFPKIDGESLLVSLSEAGMGVSSGSACSARAQEPSYVLGAIGRDAQDVKASLRITLGRVTQTEDTEIFCQALEKVLNRLRKE